MKIEDFDSKEEWEFYNWLLEAEQHGLVSELEYQPQAYELSKPIFYKEVVQYKTKKLLKEKQKIVNRTLMRGCEYTPDFRFNVHNSVIQSIIKNKHTYAYNKTIVDTKGAPGTGKSGKNISYATFPVKQKWLYQTQGIYVEKVVPENLFKETWVPEVARYTEKLRKVQKKYRGVPTIKEFVNQ